MINAFKSISLCAHTSITRWREKFITQGSLSEIIALCASNRVTFWNTKESLATINTTNSAKNQRWGEFAHGFTRCCFNKHKGKRGDKNGRNRKRGKTKRGKRQCSTEKSPRRVPLRCVQLTKPLKSYPSLLLLNSSVFWETRLATDIHK